MKRLPAAAHLKERKVRTMFKALAMGVATFGVAAAAANAPAGAPEKAFVQQYCLACHNDSTLTGGLSLDDAIKQPPENHPAVWEKVVRRLRARQMPPAGLPRPDEETYKAVVDSLEGKLDQAAVAQPDPGRTDTFRRLNRTEYHNAIRDLLDLDVDVSELLPKDESSHGFDNITVGDLSPTLLDRYLSAAEKISRLAVGLPVRSPGGRTVRVPPDLTQEKHIPGLPIGTRGGVAFEHNFPLDAEYELSIRLARDRNEEIDGLFEDDQIELLLDGERVQLFTITPPETATGHAFADAHLKARVRISAGPHEVAAAFPKQPTTVVLSERQPYEARFNFYRHRRLHPAVYALSVNGPYEAEGPGETPSRRRIFTCRPETAADREPCAREILEPLIRRAYRRPIGESDLERPMGFYRQAAEAGGFEAGVELALASVLVSPEFIFRVERDPAGAEPGEAYPVSDTELASRLSFFLWSSIPDDELLAAAERGDLREAAKLERQVRRMLADPRAEALATNFASQWLYLRNLDVITPDMRAFPDFDDNLRQALRQETLLFFESILREDRPVPELLAADYTFLNERLAKHYGIDHVYGSRFRRVDLADLDAQAHRGGLLRQGSILTVTSYATRTSPVIRGKWVLDNILGIPPPPPPPNVPALEENKLGENLTVRERLSAHRANPVCRSCHQLLDPVGFALESYDAIGRWRTQDDGKPIDDSGAMPDGSEFEGVEGLEQAVLARPELFVGVLAEKLMTYALGRGVEPTDAPAIRAAVREAGEDEYRFSSLIVGLTRSAPFRMRRAE